MQLASWRANLRFAPSTLPTNVTRMRRTKFSTELWNLDDPPVLVWIGLGLAIPALAYGVRELLDPWLENRQPYTPAFAAIALAGWVGGWRTGMVTAVTCHLWANYYFVAPRGRFVMNEQELVSALSYYLIAGVILYLSHRATSANRKLLSALKQLREVDSRRAHFLAVLGHEVRNPLAAMHAAIDLARQGGSAQRVQQGFEVLDRQLNQVSRLMDDLLDIARIDEGKLSLQQVSVPVDVLLREVTQAATVFTAPRHQKILLETGERPGQVRVDPVRMNQVFNNILHNASKFSLDGGTISVTVASSGGWCRVSVRDWGAGIPAQRVQDIFEPFIQVDRANARDDGLGLGLSIVKKLVLLHGGQIHAHSEGEGRGTEVTVMLPLDEA
jgi:signal transduction histidine kinase